MPTIRCKKCGREIGFIYWQENEWKVFIYVGFKCYKVKIDTWVHDHTKERICREHSLEEEWEDVLYNSKLWCKRSKILTEYEEDEMDFQYYVSKNAGNMEFCGEESQQKQYSQTLDQQIVPYNFPIIRMLGDGNSLTSLEHSRYDIDNNIR